MFDLPASWEGSIDISNIAAKVDDVAMVVDVLRDTWDKETLTELLDGKIFLADSVLNTVIEKRLAGDENSPLKTVVLTSTDGGLLSIDAKTKDGRKFSFTGTIEEFVKQKDGARFVYKVKKHKMPGHGLNSWIFGCISLSASQKLFGAVPSGDDMPITIKNNTVTVNLTDALADSRLAKAEIMGYSLYDITEIEGATPKNGGIELNTKFNAPDGLKNALRRILK